MKDWKKVVIAPEVSIREAIRTIDTGALQIALVVDTENRLQGTLTDGDVRRGILREVSFDDPVCKIMNSSPVVAHVHQGREKILNLMKERSLHQIPIVDGEGRLVGLEVVEALLQSQHFSNQVVIMAGGLGSRLRPMTNDCPKPMLKVGGRPILETLLRNLKEQGFFRIYLSVNYMADLITDYFGDGSAFGVEIEYLHEEKKLGTAGALSLMPEPPTEPLVVMNGDLLTKVDFQHLFDFHNHHKAVATMCVREYDFQVPYGVVKVDQHRMVGIEEKPVHKFFVNAGIYVLNPQVLTAIPQGTYCDMPAVFDRLAQEGHDSAAFPIREYWLDIGRLDDFERASCEFSEVFK
jgi:dTDP-glucose pyrophosphorylase